MTKENLNDISKFTNNGISLLEKGDFKNSHKKFLKAFEIGSSFKGFINPSLLMSLHYNLALSHFNNKNYYDAAKLYAQLPNDHHEGRYDLALSLLHQGLLDEGLEHYHHRYLRNAEDSPNFPKLPLPLASTKAELRGQTVLILNEQGFGDEIMFARTILELSSIVERAYIQVYPEMMDLFEANFKQLKNITIFCTRSFNQEFVNQFTIWCPFGNLLKALDTSHPYPLVSGLATKSFSKEKINIGFVQHPNPKSKNANNRAVDNEFFSTLGRHQEVAMHFLSIDNEYAYAQDHRSDLDSFRDTLSLIESMDLVITVDTAVAHLAICSRTPTILVYNEYLDWRWINNLYIPISLDEMKTRLKFRNENNHVDSSFNHGCYSLCKIPDNTSKIYELLNLK